VINKRIPDVRGEVLKKAREGKGLTVADLASKVCFSVKQIEQLENGEKSHFYSLAIKANAAKRVADALGIGYEEIFDFGPDLVEAANVSPEHPTEMAKPPLPSDVQIQSTKNGEKKESQHKRSRQNENAKQKVEQLERFAEPPKPIIQKNRSLYYFGGAVIVAAIGIVVFNMNQPVQPIKPVEIAKLPSEAIAAESKKEEAATPGTNSSAPSGLAQQAIEGCPPEDANTKTYRLPAASKPGNMVHVQSRSAQTVCVKDASGKLEKRSLDSGGSYSFYGKAPFIVMTTGLGQTDLFFQGYKVKIDNPNAKSIVLEEAAF